VFTRAALQIQKAPGIVERGRFDALGVALSLWNATLGTTDPHLSQLTVAKRSKSE
jgi:hypothetical protein